MHFEVEQKFPIRNAAFIEEQLHKLGASDGEKMVQVDQYFNHPARDFAKTDEALRLRQIGETNFITYKGPKLDAAMKTRKELELPLPDGTATTASYVELLQTLGFRHVAEVRKLRRTFYLKWQSRDVEIAIDEVNALGTFLEIELVTNKEGLNAAKECLMSLASELQLEDSERKSYLELLLSLKE